MADKISLLADVVANQIAAGEVVVRPASVVKEMMENAIDAGSTKIIVNSREGGSELIQIVDNGSGLSPNDARMAFEKHATSKIKSVEDIYNLHSFGFRGEALSAISSIAEVELKTRQEGDNLGTITRIKGGVYQSQEPIMCESGANFLVRNLFFNLPARKRFLEKSTTSTRQIRSEFMRVALCYPNVDFELYACDALSMKLPPASLANRIVDVVGKHIRHNLLEVSVSTSIVNITGYIGKPSAAKRSSSEQYMFVNGRYFKSQYMHKAIMRGYEKLIPANLNPAYFLYFEVAADMVDVNVHPQKIEVKFIEKEAVWQILLAAVRETLAKGGGVPLMEFDREDEFDIPIMESGSSAPLKAPKEVSNSSYNPFLQGDERGEGYDNYSVPKSVVSDMTPRVSMGGGTMLADMPFSSIYEEFTSGGGVTESESTFEFVASDEEVFGEQYEIIESRATIDTLYLLSGGYAVAALDGVLSIFDMRRVRERVLYDDMIKSSKGGGYPSQRLLFIEELRLSNAEYEMISDYATDFALLGFEIDYKGDGVIEVLGAPADIAICEIDTLLYEMIKICSMGEDIVEQTRERMISAIAHRCSLGGMTSSLEQASSLLEGFVGSHMQRYTAEGKAIFWSIDSEEIKKNLR